MVFRNMAQLHVKTSKGWKSFKIVTMITILCQEHFKDINLLHLNNPVIYYDNVIQQTKEGMETHEN